MMRYIFPGGLHLSWRTCYSQKITSWTTVAMLWHSAWSSGYAVHWNEQNKKIHTKIPWFKENLCSSKHLPWRKQESGMLWPFYFNPCDSVWDTRVSYVWTGDQFFCVSGRHKIFSRLPEIHIPALVVTGRIFGSFRSQSGVCFFGE